ncbi:Granule-associated protein OS=Castellaniella defragrans (strain DSM / CCUG 39792 / 65Phen) OX=1437824 GN=BN940_14451 PE=4 SV=1 [Castellaniella denitrificans]|uniref:TIGR01841 family phasin n=1 Tax=Castellaniella sp. TaxID=1955812 RepID=UPI002AFF06BE|nr:TIGR01841 family phasin [Castellaniella sp.]
MSANQQSLLASQKAVIDNLLAVQGTFFSGFEKLVDLNLKATKAALEDVAQKSQEAAELKDAQELLAFTSALVRPEQAVAYGKDVYEILADIQGDLSKLAEAQLAQGQKQVSEVVEQFARNAPTGSEGAVALLKSSLATATNAYESASKAARQAASAAESNFTAATNATLKAAADVGKAAKTGTRSRRAAN